MNEIELLFTDILNCPRHQLYLDRDITLDILKRRILAVALSRRFTGEPIQYILGKADFMGLSFWINPSVFIPRPETEILVETVIKYVRPLTSLSARPLDILDIGTGSGCIAIALAKFLGEANIVAIDISKAALEVAESNSRLNSTSDKIEFIHMDIFDLKYRLSGNRKFDIIVSNPPYIPSDKIKDLPKEVRFEPRLALDGGREGLCFHRRIIKDCHPLLRDNGLLVMEIGSGQYERMKKMFKDSGNLEIIDIIKDYSDIDRVVVGRLRQSQFS